MHMLGHGTLMQPPSTASIMHLVHYSMESCSKLYYTADMSEAAPKSTPECFAIGKPVTWESTFLCSLIIDASYGPSLAILI